MGRYDVELVVKARDEATAELSAIQQRIMGQFKTMGTGGNGAGGGGVGAQLAQQAEARADLEDRLFAATNSAHEVELRNLDAHYEAMAIKYQKNEQMLTLIRKTQAAEREKIVANAIRSEAGGSEGAPARGMQQAARATQDMTNAAIRAGVALGVVRGAVSLIGGAFKLANGDVEGFDKAMERLPLGLGALWRDSRTMWTEIIDEMTGKAEKARKEAEKTAQAIASLRTTRAGRALVFGAADDLDSYDRTRGREGADLERAQAQMDFDNQRRRIGEEAGKNGADPAAARVAIEQQRELLNKRLADIDKRENARRLQADQDLMDEISETAARGMEDEAAREQKLLAIRQRRRREEYEREKKPTDMLQNIEYAEKANLDRELDAKRKEREKEQRETYLRNATERLQSERKLAFDVAEARVKATMDGDEREKALRKLKNQQELEEASRNGLNVEQVRLRQAYEEQEAQKRKDRPRDPSLMYEARFLQFGFGGAADPRWATELNKNGANQVTATEQVKTAIENLNKGALVITKARFG
jgi:hypothetical protein